MHTPPLLQPPRKAPPLPPLYASQSAPSQRTAVFPTPSRSARPPRQSARTDGGARALASPAISSEAVLANARRLIHEFNRLQTQRRPRMVAANDQRKCRDVLCLVMLLGTWTAMVVLGLIAIRVGKPETLLHAYDYEGGICGNCGGDADNHTCGRPFQVLHPLLPAHPSICIAACPLRGGVVCDYSGARCFTAHADYLALFFRCAPTVYSNQTCGGSPYALAHGLPVPASAQDALCGTCAFPANASDGLPMSPSAPECLVRSLSFAAVEVTERAPASPQGVYGEFFVRLVADLGASYQQVAIGGGPVRLAASAH
jgi:hypothetical protein